MTDHKQKPKLISILEATNSKKQIKQSETNASETSKNECFKANMLKASKQIFKQTGI